MTPIIIEVADNCFIPLDRIVRITLNNKQNYRESSRPLVLTTDDGDAIPITQEVAHKISEYTLIANSIQQPARPKQVFKVTRKPSEPEPQSTRKQVNPDTLID